MSSQKKAKRLKGTRELVIDILSAHPDWNARQVHDRYRILINDPLRAVGLSAIQKHIEELRPIINKLKEEGLDDPWSLSLSIKHNISPEVTPILLKAKRFCDALDDVLTVRQAKWIVYLSSFIPQTPVLLFWADKYASWEKSHIIMFGTFDSIDLDSGTFRDYLETNTLALLGQIQPILSLERGVEPRATATLDQMEDALIAAAVAEHRALNKIYIDSFDFNNTPIMPKSYDYRDELTPLKELDFQIYQLWIYAHWLTALSKGDEWRIMKHEKIVDMIKQLREWVSILPEYKEAIEDSIQSVLVDNLTVKYKELAYLGIMPFDLIDKAGFKDIGDNPLNLPGHWKQQLNKVQAIQNNLHKVNPIYKNKNNKENSK